MDVCRNQSGFKKKLKFTNSVKASPPSPLADGLNASKTIAAVFPKLNRAKAILCKITFMSAVTSPYIYAVFTTFNLYYRFYRF